jgi:hypothetical protein
MRNEIHPASDSFDGAISRYVLFPLTLALSPEERENRRQRVYESSA